MTIDLTQCRRLFLKNYEVNINIGVHEFEKKGEIAHLARSANCCERSATLKTYGRGVCRSVRVSRAQNEEVRSLRKVCTDVNHQIMSLFSRCWLLLLLFLLLRLGVGGLGFGLLVRVDTSVEELASGSVGVLPDLSSSFEVSDESSGDGSDDLVFVVEDRDADQRQSGDGSLDGVESLLVDEDLVLEFIFGLALRPFLLAALLGVGSLGNRVLGLLLTCNWLFSLE